MNFPPRKPRFERQPGTALRITTADLHIIRHVGLHRFLRSTHLIRLFPERSPDKLIRRLGALYHAGYLDRPRAQLDYFSRSGSAPMVYALGNKGADLFARVEHATQPLTDWTDKNREAKRPYIEHALLLADFVVPLEASLSGHSGIEFIDGRDLVSVLPEFARRSGSPWALTAALQQGKVRHTVTIIPDAVFALHFKASNRRSYFFVEADRATMPITRSDFAQSSFKRKVLVYLAAQKGKQHIERLGMYNLRVLTVTTNEARTASMIDAVKSATGGKGSNIFLFADIASLACDNILSAPWLTTSSTAQLGQPPTTGLMESSV